MQICSKIQERLQTNCRKLPGGSPRLPCTPLVGGPSTPLHCQSKHEFEKQCIAWWRWEKAAKESVYIFLLKAREFKESWLLSLFPWSASACSTNSTVHCVTCMCIDRQINTNLSMGTACIRGQESESTNEGEEDCWPWRTTAYPEGTRLARMGRLHLR